jgi:phospholipase/carboxylesterase
MELMYTAHVPAGSGPFPTILALHGFGASAHDLLGIAPLVSQVIPGDEAMFLCPQGPIVLEPQPGERAYAWFPLSGGGEIEAPALVAARGVLEGFVEDARKEYPIDPERFVVMGFSQGGVMAYDLVLGQPEKYSALIALSTWLPNLVLQGLKPNDAREKLAALLIHGTEDPMVAIDNGRESLEKLKGIGMEPAWGEYPMGHEINQHALRDLLQWLSAGPFAVSGGGG